MDSVNNDSKAEGIRQTAIFGLFFGAAIASRFMLGLRTDTVSIIVSFVILFLMFWVIPYWFEKYRAIREFKTYKFKIILKFCLLLFFVGAVSSSIVKYYYFEYMRPAMFAEINDMVMAEMKNMNAYPKEMIDEAMLYVTAANYAIVSGVFNLLLALPMALVVRFNFWQREKMLKFTGRG